MAAANRASQATTTGKWRVAICVVDHWDSVSTPDETDDRQDREPADPEQRPQNVGNGEVRLWQPKRN
jgi:hypothetical protein